MASNAQASWKTMPLEDWMAAIIDYRGKTPEKTLSGIPLVTAKIVKGGRIEDPEEFIAENAYEQWMRRGIPEAGDVVLTTEAPLGEVAQLDGRKVALAQRIITLRGKPGLLDNTYLKFALQSQPIQEQLHGRASGSTVTGIKQSELRKLQLTFPSLEEQQSVAGILGSLDDKIAVNRRINQTLEAMAQAIFKSWFVDFDPVKAKIAAKAEGRDPLHAAMSVISGKAEAELDTLPPEAFEQLAATAALFPDEMEASELGEIPKGWTYKALTQLTDKIGSGSTPRGGKEVYLEVGVALIRSQNIYDSLFVWEGLARISDDAASQLKGVTVQEDDVLLNITGASILRTCVVQPEALPARVNQHVAIIRAKAGVPPRFIHMHLLRREIKNHLLGMNTGGSREAITKAHIEALTLLTPTQELLSAFQMATNPLFRQVQRFAHQVRVLDELRDTLLPKLLSGELSVEALAEPAEAA